MLVSQWLARGADDGDAYYCQRDGNLNLCVFALVRLLLARAMIRIPRERGNSPSSPRKLVGGGIDYQQLRKERAARTRDTELLHST